jgi:hypothetical protein
MNGFYLSFLFVVIFISPVLNFMALGMCGLGRMVPPYGRLAPAFAKLVRAPRKNSFGLGLFSLAKDKFKPDIIIIIYSEIFFAKHNLKRTI